MIEIHGICNRVLWKWRIFNRFLGERLRRNCWLLTSQNHHHDGSHFGIDGICRERKVKWSGFGNRTKLWLEIIGELKICYFFQIKWVQDLRFPREIWNWPDLAVFLTQSKYSSICISFPTCEMIHEEVLRKDQLVKLVFLGQTDFVPLWNSWN